MHVYPLFFGDKEENIDFNKISNQSKYSVHPLILVSYTAPVPRECSSVDVAKLLLQ